MELEQMRQILGVPATNKDDTADKRVEHKNAATWDLARAIYARRGRRLETLGLVYLARWLWMTEFPADTTIETLAQAWYKTGAHKEAQ